MKEDIENYYNAKRIGYIIPFMDIIEREIEKRLELQKNLKEIADILVDGGYKREYRIYWNPATRSTFYRVDFANPVLRHIVEFDEPGHELKGAKDRKRDLRLMVIGWSVTRLKHGHVWCLQSV